MIGLIVWCIIIIFIAACITPWWFFPVVITVSILSQVLFSKKQLKEQQRCLGCRVSLHPFFLHHPQTYTPPTHTGHPHPPFYLRITRFIPTQNFFSFFLSHFGSRQVPSKLRTPTERVEISAGQSTFGLAECSRQQELFAPFALMKIKDVNSCNLDCQGGWNMVILKPKCINLHTATMM